MGTGLAGCCPAGLWLAAGGGAVLVLLVLAAVPHPARTPTAATANSTLISLFMMTSTVMPAGWQV